MSRNPSKSEVYHFDDVEVNCREFRILKAGQPQKITPRAFEVLAFLIERGNCLVSKQELFESVWKESFVSDNALTRMIKEVRRVIGDDADSPRYIETVPKLGYRFIAQVESAVKNQPVSSQETQFESSISSIAVLPFTTSSNDPNNEYLSEGITENLINNLSQLSFLRVVPRSTVFYFQHRETEPLAIGRKLNVRAVVTGRVVRRGETLIVSTELIDVLKESQLWGEKYHRPISDIFELQEEISQKIFGELQLKLKPEEKERLVHRPTQSVEAYRLYLKGRYFWNRRPQGLQRGIEYFEQALEKDPDFALAYAGIADSYSTLGSWENGAMAPTLAMPKACAAANKALSIDGNLAEAHTAIAYTKLHYEWDLKSAEEGFKRALELNGSYVHAYHWLSHCYMARGMIKESLEASLRALELDPLDLIINSHLIWHYWLAREPDNALIQAERTRELNPSDGWAAFFAGLALEVKGEYDDAIAEFEKARILSGDITLTKAAQGHALACCGRPEHARKIIEELEEQRKKMFVPAYDIAVIFSGMDEKELALNWLEQAIDERSGWATYLAVEPRLDKLRRESRFSELVWRVGISRI
jgi:TolB-like protein/Tfp pilus assembly protein PilF